MNTEVKKYSIIMGIITLILVSILAIQVNAEEPTTGSITIIAHEQKNGDTTTNPPLAGIEYTIYKVDESCEDINDAYYYIEEHQLGGVSEITNEEGIAFFGDLELGRYFVVLSGRKDGVTDADRAFLVDIPMTNLQGTGWNYDITVEPKIQTTYGNLEVTKTDIGGNPIEGVTFKVQVGLNTVLPESLENLPDGEWIDYIPEGSDKVLTITTDKNGKIKLENLPSTGGPVFFRLVEISAPNGYIINNKLLTENTTFVVSDFSNELSFTEFDNDVVPSIVSDWFKNYIINQNLTSITYVNEKPNIVKKVKNSEGEFVDSIGVNATDRLTFKITADVPMQIKYMDTYKITDELPQGMILDRDSIKIEGTTAYGSGIIPEDVYTLSQDGLEITFDNNMIAVLNNIIITYEATIDKDNVVIGGNGNINTATLEYTNKINENGDEESTTTVSDTAEVHTGAVLLEKVEKGNTSTKLAGAKFKIATTKDNAEDGIFVKDETGADIEVTTGDNGQAIIEGLKYADDGSNTSYWLVETQAPSYQEDGVTKYYNLLKAPVEVKVGKITHQSAVQIENGKGFELPETGSIGLIIFTVVGIAVMAGAVVLNKKQIKE